MTDSSTALTEAKRLVKAIEKLEHQRVAFEEKCAAKRVELLANASEPARAAALAILTLPPASKRAFDGDEGAQLAED
jgi:glycine cleavage system pyridoxal-binding protein P